MIGHEISHSFDNLGAEFDAEGRLRNWWTPADLAQFKKAGKALVAQYDAYEPLPGLHLRGAQTQGENTADVAGLAAALDAAARSCGRVAALLVDARSEAAAYVQNTWNGSGGAGRGAAADPGVMVSADGSSVRAPGAEADAGLRPRVEVRDGPANEMKPLSDHNVVYEFHDYEPFPFSHQGADWDDTWQKLHDIPYPAAKLEGAHLPDLDRILDGIDRALDRPNSLTGVED